MASGPVGGQEIGEVLIEQALERVASGLGVTVDDLVSVASIDPNVQRSGQLAVYGALSAINSDHARGNGGMAL